MILFPKALIACIAEARAPDDRELGQVAEHIWNDAFRPATGLAWDRLVFDDGKRLWLLRAVYRATCGMASVERREAILSVRWTKDVQGANPTAMSGH